MFLYWFQQYSCKFNVKIGNMKKEDLRPVEIVYESSIGSASRNKKGYFHKFF